LAPGVDILSLGTFSDWSILTGITMTGTSMATPHVSGAALLYLSRNPKATPAEVKRALIKAGKSQIFAVPAGTTNKTVWVGKF
jgi:subtilisin family serine protease